MRIPVVLAFGVALLQACSASVGTSSDKDAEQPQTIESEAASPASPASPASSPEPEAETGLNAALTVPHDVPPLDTPCKTRQEFAVGQVQSALSFASNGCTTDAECVQATRSTSCRGSCPTSVLETHALAYESYRDSIDERVCSTYREDKCPYAAPSCMKGAPACVEGRCTWAQPD